MTPPVSWWQQAVDSLGIELWRIPIVVVSAIGIYFFLVLLVRLYGARSLSSLYMTDTIAIIMLGAIAGRVILGHPPTLATGVIALVCVLTLSAIMRFFNRRFGARSRTAPHPIVIMADGEVLEQRLRAAHVSPVDLYAALRQRGIFRTQDARAVIFEQTGSFTVIRRGQEIDSRLLRGVIGAEDIVGPEVEAEGDAGAGAGGDPEGGTGPEVRGTGDAGGRF